MIRFALIWLGAPKPLGKRPTPTLQGLSSRACYALIEHGLAEAQVRISFHGAGLLCTSPHVLWVEGRKVFVIQYSSMVVTTSVQKLE